MNHRPYDCSESEDNFGDNAYSPPTPAAKIGGAEITEMERNGIRFRQYIFEHWDGQRGKVAWERQVEPNDGVHLWPLIHADFPTGNADERERARLAVQAEFDKMDWEAWKQL